MDDADKLSAPSIPGPGCMPRRSSCYGRCFARSVPADAALWLMRRKTRDKPPSPAVRILHALRRDSQSAGTQICMANPTGLRHKDSMLSSGTKRAELMPSRLFSSARHNCSREAVAGMGCRIANPAELRQAAGGGSRERPNCKPRLDWVMFSAKTCTRRKMFK